MRSIKIIASILITLLVVIVIAVVVGLRNLDVLVEAAIESVGPMVTQTDVQVDRVDIELGQGRGEVFGLTVGNPEGFSDRPILRVGQTALELRTASLREDVIVLREILVDGAHINAEHRDLTEINLKTMLDNILPEQAEEPYKSSTASPDVRFMVEKLSFTGASLTLSSDELGERELTLADLHLEDLGDREEGLSPVELTRALIRPLLHWPGSGWRRSSKPRPRVRSGNAWRMNCPRAMPRPLSAPVPC